MYIFLWNFYIATKIYAHIFVENQVMNTFSNFYHIAAVVVHIRMDICWLDSCIWVFIWNFYMIGYGGFNTKSYGSDIFFYVFSLFFYDYFLFPLTSFTISIVLFRARVWESNKLRHQLYYYHHHRHIIFLTFSLKKEKIYRRDSVCFTEIYIFYIKSIFDVNRRNEMIYFEIFKDLWNNS